MLKLGEVSLGIYKLGELGELGKMSYRTLKLDELGEILVKMEILLFFVDLSMPKGVESFTDFYKSYKSQNEPICKIRPRSKQTHA